MNAHSANGRIGALERWGRATADERREGTRKAREAQAKRFEDLADPQGRMSEADRVAAGERLRQAHMLRMTRAAAEAKRRKKQQKPA